MKYFIAIFIVSLLLSCNLTANYKPSTDLPITFAEVSQPYLDQYGQPEEVTEYISSDYHTIDWWWWTKGFMVGFANTPYDGIDGWAVDNTYSFSPIGYLTKSK